MTRMRSSHAGRRSGPRSGPGRSPTRAPSRTARPRPGLGQPENSYVLEMLPYPSGEPHIGHLKCYSVGDAIAHFQRRLAAGSCIRWAMTHSVCRPRIMRSRPAFTRATRSPIDRRLPAAVPLLGDLDRLVPGASTSDPSYYRWTQWIFLELFRAGLAYRARGGRQVVPQRPDRPRQRAGRRRGPLRALRGDRRSPPARAVVPAHHRLRRAAAWRPRRDRLARACQDHAAQLDRPQRGG